MGVKLSKKGQSVVYVVSALLVLILLLALTGIISIPVLYKVLPGHDYLIDVNMENNITDYEDLSIDFLITNPQDVTIEGELEIIYDHRWTTSNRYIRSNDRIPIGSLLPGKVEKYSIEFDPPRVLESENYNFTFNLYADNELVDSREEIVYVR